MGHAVIVGNPGRLLDAEVGRAVPAGLDGVGATRLTLVPEIQLYLAQDAIIWWARMEAHAGNALSPPFWASAWMGGQAVARYVLDHPEVVTGRRVLDVASGSGLVAIAAGLAGAAHVTANDIDPYAAMAIGLNAELNGVDVAVSCGDLLEGDGGDADVVLAGDVFYDERMARSVMAFFGRVTARGGIVLVGDPGRGFLPRARMRTVATYSAGTAADFIDAERTHTRVLRPL
jgi:predicted nicotinamide N-methyase